MKVKLTSVQRYTTKKDGTPLVTSKGKPYTSIRIKTQEHGDKLLSGFDNEQTKSWKEGDEVEIDVVQKGEYLNFSTPKKPEGGAQIVEALTILKKLEFQMGIVLETLRDIKGPKQPDIDYPEMTEEPNFDVEQ